MTFQRGYHPIHDMAAAGRKGKAVSPWRTRNPIDPKTRRLHEIRRARERLFGIPAETSKARGFR